MLGFLKILLIVVLPNLFPDWTHTFCFTVDDILAEVSSLKALSRYRARDFYDAYRFYSIWQQGNWGDEELFDQNCYWAVCSKAKSIKCIKNVKRYTVRSTYTLSTPPVNGRLAILPFFGGYLMVKSEKNIAPGTRLKKVERDEVN